jgi:hypothetical protein
VIPHLPEHHCKRHERPERHQPDGYPHMITHIDGDRSSLSFPFRSVVPVHLQLIVLALGSQHCLQLPSCPEPETRMHYPSLDANRAQTQ